MSSYQHSFVKTESTCGVYEVVMDSFAPPKFRSGFDETKLINISAKINIKNYNKLNF
jgi:hypothetical protein